MNSASVVINTYNRAAYIGNAITSILKQSYPTIELIVVNGPSIDNTQLIITTLKLSGLAIKYLTCPSRNLSESRNIGISACSGDIIFFLDDDAVAHPDWISRLMVGYLDNRVGAVGGFTYDHTGMSFQCKYTVCDRFGIPRYFNALNPEELTSQPYGQYFSSLLGTNCSFRKSVLYEVGGFDEIFAYMLDETDLCARVIDKGYRVITQPDAFVFHKYAPSHTRNSERLPMALYASVKSKVYFCLKHNNPKGVISSSVINEIERYKNELQVSNMWHLERKQISTMHYLKLTAEIENGIREGLKAGLNELNFDKTPEVFFTSPSSPASNSSFEPVITKSNCTTKLKIYFVSQGYPPFDTSGIARWTHACATSLSEIGHEIHVLTKSQSLSSHVDYKDGVWIHYLEDKFDDDQPFIASTALPATIRRRCTAVLKELLRSYDIWGMDIVSAPIWDVEGILATEYLDIPTVLSLHTTYALMLPYKPEWQTNRIYKRNHVDRVIKAEEWMFRNCKYILANSKEIVAEIDRTYGTFLTNDMSRIEVIPHGLEFDISKNQTRNFETRKNKPLKILFVGRIESRKGPDVLLQSLLHGCLANTELEVVLVGQKVDEPADFNIQLEALVARISIERKKISVRFTGYVDDVNLATQYRNADIFIAPSRFESFGLVLIEAMAMQVPIISSAVGGILEIVEHEETGLLCSPGNPSDLAQTIDKLASSKALRMTLSINAYQKYLNVFTGKAMAKSLESYFKKVVDREQHVTK